MKALTPILLSLSLFNTPLFANDGEINPDTARAYQGYLLTFLWPEGQSSELIEYEDVLAVDDLLRFSEEELEQNTPNTITPTSIKSTPFDNFAGKLDRRVTILSNQKWTLIFKATGDTIQKSFTSPQIQEGYPELTGNISIKLGRYLESDIYYNHYLFNYVTPTETDVEASNQIENNQANNNVLQQIGTTESNTKQLQPTLVLPLHQSNRTASKKVNYLDHPTIGTLLYFEPMELEEAMEAIALETITPETGASLNYDELQNTNELFESSPKIDPPFIPQ